MTAAVEVRGLGKAYRHYATPWSRLAEWLAIRAHEVGAATSYRALHNPIGTPNDGLADMLARALRCGAFSNKISLKTMC